MWARVRHSPSTSPVASRLWGKEWSIRDKRIANLSSKSSLIDRQTSRRREEDDPPGDESPPPESVPDAVKSLLLLHGLEDEAP
ncbi:unnamed protein product [Spirodela intermedia]|uniref:Uncharacterized protein n=1 Tax=Spirodela intermedia TaxID=51605 RepID=A0A7I8KCN7_SPIIN|nr:unnamed protein product [Spirodela intermedia]